MCLTVAHGPCRTLLRSRGATLDLVVHEWSCQVLGARPGDFVLVWKNCSPSGAWPGQKHSAEVSCRDCMGTPGLYSVAETWAVGQSYTMLGVACACSERSAVLSSLAKQLLVPAGVRSGVAAQLAASPGAAFVVINVLSLSKPCDRGVRLKSWCAGHGQNTALPWHGQATG